MNPRRTLSNRDLQLFIVEWMAANFPTLEPEEIILRCRNWPHPIRLPVVQAAVARDPDPAERAN